MVFRCSGVQVFRCWVLQVAKEAKEHYSFGDKIQALNVEHGVQEGVKSQESRVKSDDTSDTRHLTPDTQLYAQHPTPQRLLYMPFTARLVHALTSNKVALIGLVVMLGVGMLTTVGAQGMKPIVPKISLGLEQSSNPKDISATLQVMLLLTILTLAPSILIMTTAFTRIVIVLSILKSAMGLPSVPPNQVMVGLALFMTFFVMRPTFEKINEQALQPYFANKIPFQTAMDRAVNPLRSFMVRQTYTRDLTFFVNMAKLDKPPQTVQDVPLTVIIPAFITSELKTAFIIGFYIYLPFLIVDIVVASILMSMGMMMVPPNIIALPAKILLFVLANGWTLILGSLAKGFR